MYALLSSTLLYSPPPRRGLRRRGAERLSLVKIKFPAQPQRQNQGEQVGKQRRKGSQRTVWMLPKACAGHGRTARTELNWFIAKIIRRESLTAANIKLKNMCMHGLRLCWSNSAITYWWGLDWVYTCTPTSIYTFSLRNF
jgi:hypothetical protein